MKPVSVVILVFILAVYLSLMGLDTTSFWDDEAHVGIIAKNFLATGSFTAWDGRNLYAYRNGTNLDKHLRIINPPLEYLLTAGSFSVFGASTWSGRLPFVVVGLMALVVFWLLLRQEFKRDVWIWFYCLGGLALSPTFLLHIRQCRYYALSLLLSLLTFYLYLQCIQTKRLRNFVLLAVVCILGFYSNHLLNIAFILTLAVMHLVVYRRDFSRNDWGKLAITVGLFCLATIPYALYYRIWDRPDIPTVEIWYIRRVKLLWWNFRDLNLTAYMPWTVAVALAFFLFRHRKQQTDETRTVWQWLTLCLAYVILIALLSPQPTKVPGVADVRYLFPVQPFFVGLIAVPLRYLHHRMPLLALTLFAVTLSTNILTLSPDNREFRWLLPAYIKEVHQDYPTSYGEAAQFLVKHAAQDDLVFTFPDYTNYPLLFYTGDHLRFCCLLNDRTHLSRDRIEALNAPLFLEQHAPDWFVAFGNHPVAYHMMNFFSHPKHESSANGDRYTYTLVEALDVYWKDTQRPELPKHSFGPKTDYNRYTGGVYIFRRGKKTPSHNDTLLSEGD